MAPSIRLLFATCVIALASHATGASADDKADYQKRVATRFVNLFQELDRDRDGRVTRAEASGDLNFLPSFNDMDINGDNAVTTEELRRFLELRIGVTTVTAAAQ
jgi:Ca2+-binding EF-hand superfamily protein